MTVASRDSLVETLYTLVERCSNGNLSLEPLFRTTTPTIDDASFWIIHIDGHLLVGGIEHDNHYECRMSIIRTINVF